MFGKEMISKYVLAAVLLLHPIIGKSEPSSPLVGVYLDTLTGLSARGGYAFVVYTNKKDEVHARETSFFLYPDAEIGINAQKLSVGVGVINFFAVGRAGLSYAKKGSLEYQGLDLVGSMMGFSLKVGIYQEKSTKDSLVTFGFGLGF